MPSRRSHEGPDALAPYASLVAIGAKTIETRSWGTSYRGPLLFHAAKKCDEDIAADCRRAYRVLEEHIYVPPNPEMARAGMACLGETFGHVLAVARLVDCRPILEPPNDLEAEFGTFGTGRYGWVLADVIPLHPIVPWKGSQGLWDVPEKLRGWVIGSMHRGWEMLDCKLSREATPR